METEIISLSPACMDGEALGRAAKIIREGGLVAFPTETVYGLGGDALNADSARKIYAAKGRPSDNPLIVHIASLSDLNLYAREVPGQALELARTYWPGPMTLVLKKTGRIPDETSGGLDTVALRMPANPIALELIRLSQTAIAAPSANLSGRPSPTCVEHVREDLFGRIDMILDGGGTAIGLESTIIDFSEGEGVLLRPGAIDREMLRRVIGELKTDPALHAPPDEKTRPRAPGMKYRHYAPKAEITIVNGEREAVIAKINFLAERDMLRGKRIGILATKETAALYPFGIVSVIGSREDEKSIAHNLFSVLRGFDEKGVDLIYSESFAQKGLGEAVMNRLLKAASYRSIEAR